MEILIALQRNPDRHEDATDIMKRDEKKVRTSQDIGLVHVVGADDDDPPGSPALQQRPHLVSGAGIHTCCGFIQEEDLQEQTLRC